MKRKKIFSAAGLTLLGAVAFYVIISIIISVCGLVTTNYSLTSQKLNNNLNVIILTDLHTASFGKNNERLIEKIRREAPDLILTVGDMVNYETEDFSCLSLLYRQLSQIAPTYSSLGNHEFSNPHLEEIKELLRANSFFLDNEYIETEIKGTRLRIGGLMGYLPDDEKLNSFLKDFESTDRFKLLLMHCPEYYIWGVNNFSSDLTVCGHTHGGQVILPFTGGIYAPEQGFFPYFDYGVYEEKGTTLLISRGLGSSNQPAPRFNNIPEIINLTLSPR